MTTTQYLSSALVIASLATGCGPTLVELGRVQNGGLLPSAACSARVPARPRGELVAAEALAACGVESGLEPVPVGATFVMWRVASSQTLAGPRGAAPVWLQLLGPRDLETGAGALALSSGSRAEGVRDASSAASLTQGSSAAQLDQRGTAQALADGGNAAALTDGSGAVALTVGSSAAGLGGGAAERGLESGSGAAALDERTTAQALDAGDRERGGVTIRKRLDGSPRLALGSGRRMYALRVRSELSAPTEELIVVDFVPAPLTVNSAPGSVRLRRPGGTLVVWLDRQPLEPRREREYRIVVSFDRAPGGAGAR